MAQTKADRAIEGAYGRVFDRCQVPMLHLGGIYDTAKKAWLGGRDIDAALIEYADARGIPYNAATPDWPDNDDDGKWSVSYGSIPLGKVNVR